MRKGPHCFPSLLITGNLEYTKEWAACQRLHEQFGLPPVTYMDLSGFGKTVPSGLTDSSLRINEDAFLPGRNLLFVLAGGSPCLQGSG